VTWRVEYARPFHPARFEHPLLELDGILRRGEQYLPSPTMWRNEGEDRPDAKLLVLPVGTQASAWPAPPGIAVMSTGYSGG